MIFNISIQRTHPVYSSSMLRLFKMSAPRFGYTTSSVFTQRKRPNVLRTQQSHSSVITRCVVKKQTCETFASVIAGKLKTSSVLTTNKDKSQDKTFWLHILIVCCVFGWKPGVSADTNWHSNSKIVSKLIYFFVFFYETRLNLDIFALKLGHLCDSKWCLQLFFVFTKINQLSIKRFLMRVHATLKNTQKTKKQTKEKYGNKRLKMNLKVPEMNLDI